MTKRLFVILLILTCASIVWAQNTKQKRDYHKIEVAGGYSIMQADGILGDGDMFSDKPEEPLTTNQSTSIFTFFGGQAPENLFPPVPYSYSGKRHRANLQGFNASATYNVSKYIGVKFEMSGNYRSNKVRGSEIVLGILCTLPGCNSIPIQASYPAGTYAARLVYPAFMSQTSQKHYNYLGGIQIKNNSPEKKIKPFAHALAGVSKQSVKLKDIVNTGDTFDVKNRDFAIYGTDKLTNIGFAMEFGGGLDIRLNKRLDIRVIQFDYNPVRIKNQQILAFKKPITDINIPNNPVFQNTADPNFTQYSTADINIRNRWQNNIRIGFGIVFH